MYPKDSPSTSMTGYWSSGQYTPVQLLSYIQDDVTPIDKNSMVNSVGKHLSLLMNFVNERYLARSDSYIKDGYIDVTHVGSLVASGFISNTNHGSITLCSNLMNQYDIKRSAA